MAIFLSKIKKILNLGTKSITANGTYNASTDGYDGYSQVSVNVPTVTPTSITPSNASPAALTANSPVTPTANGYAISSYNNVTPSSTPASVSSGDIIKASGNGVIVDNMPPTPTSITPSNANPVILNADTPVKPTDNGLAIVDLYNIGPNNSNPVQLSTGEIYKPLSSGYAISSYSSKTPSDSSPASVSSGAIIKNAGNSTGYLYASSGLGKVKSGTISASTGNVVTLNCGFQPKKICIYAYGGANSYYNGTYDSDVDGEYYRAGWRTTSSSTSANRYAIGGTSNGCITEINSTGFKWRGSSNFSSLYYFAIG